MTRKFNSYKMDDKRLYVPTYMSIRVLKSIIMNEIMSADNKF